MNQHDRGFLEFLAEPSRRRIETLLDLGQKRRRDLLDLLHHAVRLDPRFSQHITGSDAFAGPIEAQLLKLGAPAHCYIIGGSSNLDGHEMSLRDALDAVVGAGNGAFVSCIPGQLGFFEYEDAKSSYLLSKAVKDSRR